MADKKAEHPFFERAFEVAPSDAGTLKTFLKKRLQPWRWEIMLGAGAIRVERKGKLIAKLTLDERLRAGDMVFLDDTVGGAWPTLIKKATTEYRDYVFCPQRGGDSFLNHQYTALLMNPKMQAVPAGIKHLYGLANGLTAMATAPIRHFIFVAHASEYGDIELPMRDKKARASAAERPDDNADAMNWESLKEAIAARALRLDGRYPMPVVLPRPESKNGKFVPCAVIVRGCSSGVHTILLQKIHEAFGYLIDTVIMPKFFDAAFIVDRRSATSFACSIEFFQHNYFVSSKTPLTRDEIIAAFKKARMKDWLGEAVPDRKWDDWVGQNVDAHHESTEAMKVNVTGRDRPLELRVTYDGSPLHPTTLYMDKSGSTDPSATEIGEYLMKALKKEPFYTNTDWPIWKRLGLADEKAFKDFWTFEVDKAAPKVTGKVAVRAVRYHYRVRPPLLLKGDVLLATYWPKGEKGTASNLINYNDDRIFGRFTQVPEGWEQTL